MNKKSIIVMTVLLLSGFSGHCTGEIATMKDCSHVRKIDNAVVHRHIDDMISAEHTRSTVRTMALGCAVAGGVYSVKKWFDKPVMGPVTQNQVNNLNARVTAVEQNANNAEEINYAERVNGLGWAEWFKIRGRDAAKSIYSYVPGIVLYMARTYVSREMGKLIWPVLPSWGNYLVDSPSMSWCLSKKTRFLHTTNMILNWFKAREVQPAHPFLADDLRVSVRQLVFETEKVLGYMGYMLGQIPSDEKDTRERALHCMSQVAYDSNCVVDACNEYTSNELSKEAITRMIFTIKKSLFSVICQLENFDYVVMASGHDTNEGKDIFTPLKNWVFPEWKQFKPQLPGPDIANDQLRNELVDLVAQNIEIPL